MQSPDNFTIGIIYLHAIVSRIDYVNVTFTINCDIRGVKQVSVLLRRSSEAHQELAIHSELYNFIITEAGNENIPFLI